jgi:hypothetical protein
LKYDAGKPQFINHIKRNTIPLELEEEDYEHLIEPVRSMINTFIDFYLRHDIK